MIKRWSEFFSLVCEMRLYQKEYFRSRSAFSLAMSRKKERELDACIEDLARRMGNKQPELPIREDAP